jgi:hypothetical protein
MGPILVVPEHGGRMALGKMARWESSRLTVDEEAQRMVKHTGNLDEKRVDPSRHRGCKTHGNVTTTDQLYGFLSTC